MALQAGAFVFEGQICQDHNPEKSNTVEKPRSMDSYIQKEYAHLQSQEGMYFRDQLREVGKAYGTQVHEIRGNGCCLPNAFSTSILYKMNGNPDLIQKYSEVLFSLDLTNIAPDIEEIMGLLDELRKGPNDLFRDEILSNSSIMDAFSHIHREMARQKLPEFNDVYQSLELLDEAAPKKTGEEMGIATFGALSKALGLRVHVVTLLKDREVSNLQKYPNHEDDGIPDLVFVRKGAHFISVIPEKERIQAQLGLKDRSPLYQEQKVAAVAEKRIPRGEAKLDDGLPCIPARSIAPCVTAPQHNAEGSRIRLIAIGILIALGALFMKQYM